MILLLIIAVWAALGIVPMVLRVTREFDCNVEDFMFICVFGILGGPLAGIAVGCATLFEKYGDKVIFARRK